MKYFLLRITFLLAAVNPLLFAQGSSIEDVVSKINADSIASTVSALENFQTRYCLHPNRFQVVDYLKNKFTEIGITDIELDTFMCRNNFYVDTVTLQINVIGTITGSVNPDEVYIIGGHYDSFSHAGSMYEAPGADDDATGTAGTIEIARAIKEANYIPPKTIKFIAFAAEELMMTGNSGSRHYASFADSTGMNIKLMTNLDMIGNSTTILQGSKVLINYYTNDTSPLLTAKNAASGYSLLTPITGSPNIGADSYPFFEKGFPVVFWEEFEFCPRYHMWTDKLQYLNKEYMREVTRAAGAAVLMHQLNITGAAPGSEMPLEFSLGQNYPNPFNPATAIEYSLPEGGYVQLKIYDQLGRLVSVLTDEYMEPGKHTAYFNGSTAASGIYYYQLTAGNFRAVKKMTLIK